MNEGPPSMPALVGVINLSPESPNADSVAQGVEPVLRKAAAYRGLGARYVEIGARSTAADAPVVDEGEEQRRLLPALAALKGAGFRVSVDTWSAQTAARAVEGGADLLNFLGTDFSAELRGALAGSSADFVTAYMPYGDPYRMREAPEPIGSIEGMLAHFHASMAALGLPRERVVVDPNIGVLHPKLRADRMAAIRYRMHVLHALPRLRAPGWRVMVDHTRRDGELSRVVWAACLLEVGPEFIRTHDAEVFAELLGRAVGY
ncbi:MAG: dihydropteroate synthase [Dehalococcoidia bacterium]